MSNIQLQLAACSENEAHAGVKLSARDVSDALRLMNLLLKGRSPARAELLPADGKSDASIDVAKRTPKAKARAILRRRRDRTHHFDASMFSESAWDMLLALFANEDSDRRMTITGLSDCSDAPASTALRWIDYLEQAKLIVRRPSPLDRRVVFIDITPLGSAQMNAYLESAANFEL